MWRAHAHPENPSRALAPLSLKHTRVTAKSHENSQDFVIAQNFLRGRLVPSAVRDHAARDRNVQRVADQAVLQDPVAGRAGAEGRGRVDLREESSLALCHLPLCATGENSSRRALRQSCDFKLRVRDVSGRRVAGHSATCFYELSDEA